MMMENGYIGGQYMSICNGNSEAVRRSLSWTTLARKEPVPPYATNYGSMQRQRPSSGKSYTNLNWHTVVSL